jgi:hypothetical protein
MATTKSTVSFDDVQKMMTDHTVAEAHRLDRIENKIDKLSDAVISLARAEEKLINLENDRNTMLDKIIRIEEKIDNVDLRMTEQETASRVVIKVFWIVLTALVGACVAYLIK